MIVAVIGAVTAVVMIVKLGEVVDPAATVMEGGTAATNGMSLESITNVPPTRPGAFNVTRFAVVDTPPAIVVGDNVKAETACGFTTKVSVLLTPS